MYAAGPSHFDMIPLSQQIARESFAGMSDAMRRESQEYPALRENHINTSHETIWNAAQIALERARENDPAQALILGAGSCADIPLEWLADAFDQTTLVDIDTRYTLQAKANLPVSLRKKVNVVTQDITGVFEEATAWLGDDFKSHYSYLGHATKLFASIDPKVDRPEFDSHDFVVSHLVHNQFGASLSRIVREGGERQFGFSRASLFSPRDDLYRDTLKELGEKMQAAHFDLLADTVKPEGVIHFAGSFDPRYSRSLDAYYAPRPIELLNDRFSLLTEPLEWQWQFGPGRRCRVAAYALQVAE